MCEKTKSTNEESLSCLALTVLLSGHLYHGLRRSVQEDEFLEQRLFQLHLAGLAHHKDIRAEFQDSVHTWQLLKHDGPRYPVEELSDKLPDDQHHRHVETHNAVGERGDRKSWMEL